MKNKDSKNNKSLIFTRETLGMTLMLFSAIVLLSLFTGRTVFAGFGAAICSFMYGTFGYGSYFVVALLAYLGEWLTFEKYIKVKVFPAIWCSVTILCIFLLFHTVTTRNFTFDSTYIASCYMSAEAGWSGYTFGGVISALIVYPVVAVTKLIGAYIIFSLLIVFFAFLSVMSVRKHYFVKKRKKVEENSQQEEEIPASEVAADYPAQPYGEGAFAGDQPVGGSPSFGQQPAYGNTQYSGQQGYGGQYPYDSQPPYGQQNNNNQPYTQQPYDQQPYNGQQPYAGQSYGQQPYGYVSPAQQVFGNPQPADEPPAIDYKNDAHKILFEDGDFNPEGYRRNGIFDENSYFNHPIHNDGDYQKGFSSGKKTSGTSIQPTYSSSQTQSVEQQNTSVPGNVVYGDEPADDLTGFTDANTGEYPSQPQQPYTSTQQPDSRSNPYEINPFGDEDNTGELPEDNLPSYNNPYVQPDNNSSQPADSQPTDVFSSRDEGVEGGDRFMPRGREMPNPDAQQDMPTRFTDSRRGVGFTDEGATEDRNSGVGGDRRSAGFNDTRGDSYNNPEPEDNAGARNDRNDRSGRLFDIFGSDNRSTDEDNSETESGSPMSRGRDVGRPDLFGGERHDFDPYTDTEEDTSDIEETGRRDRSNAGLFDDVPEDDEDINFNGDEERNMFSERPSPLPESRTAEPVSPVVEQPEPKQPPVERTEKKPEPTPPPPPHVWKKYVRPGFDLLDDYPEYANVNNAEIEENKRIIIETLENFRIASEISDVAVGPAITRYDVIILDKTNIKKSLQYKESIAMALKKDNVNAYLNYAKGALSIEVPNNTRTIVGLKNMLMSPAYMNSKPNSLTFVLGKNMEGLPVCPDITKMPHLLVAGTSGSGKSVCLNAILVSLLYKYGPEELRLILVDPKQIEFISYDKLPHLMINEIILDVDKAIKALNWAIKEMERRYSLFKDMTESGINAKGGIRTATKDINEYNSHLEEGLEKLPKIVIILDEFGDLMLQAKKEIESRIIKLVQKARAAGIHLILATQRPSVDCVTGLIKSNLPTRMGFKVGSVGDSQVIFDRGGAEKLLGNGDMYFRSPDNTDLVRIQCCYVGTREVEKVTDFIKSNNETYFDQSVSDFINTVEEPEATASISEGAESEETKIDEVYLRALKYCVESNKASVSMLQRRFPIGYMKACKIIDWMENMSYITKGEGPNSRKVLLSREEFINIYGDIDV